MNNLSEKMQQRLDAWRKNTLPKTVEKSLKKLTPSCRGGKGDFGDVLTIEQWEEEAIKSQTRR